MKHIISAALVFGCVCSGINLSAQTNNLIEPLLVSRLLPAGLVRLEFPSHPDAMYQIEVRTNLSDTNWICAERNLVSQGSNTVWADYGFQTTSLDIFSSMDETVLRRFYRVVVSEWLTNSLTISTTVSNLAPGSVISNVFTISGNATATQNLSAIELRIDGNRIRSDNRLPFSLPFDSRRFPNGEHRLSVISRDAGFSETTDPEIPEQYEVPGFAVTNVAVIFSNFLSNVRLKFNGYMGTNGDIQVVYGTWQTPRQWQVDITEHENLSNVFRSFSGEGGQIIVEWDGKDSIGNYLTPQRVDYVFYDLGAAQNLSEMMISPGGGETSQTAKTVEPFDPENIKHHIEDVAAAALG
jgi:hypothetical protein